MKTSYIHIGDLVETLKAYYDDQLNEVNMARIYLPLIKMAPSNTLKAQVEDSDIRSALFQLPTHLSAAIDWKLEDNLDAYDYLLSYYLNLDINLHMNLANEEDKFLQFLEDTYLDGLEQLANIVHKML